MSSSAQTYTAVRFLEISDRGLIVTAGGWEFDEPATLREVAEALACDDDQIVEHREVAGELHVLTRSAAAKSDANANKGRTTAPRRNRVAA